MASFYPGETLHRTASDSLQAQQSGCGGGAAQLRPGEAAGSAHGALLVLHRERLQETPPLTSLRQEPSNLGRTVQSERRSQAFPTLLLLDVRWKREEPALREARCGLSRSVPVCGKFSPQSGLALFGSGARHEAKPQWQPGIPLPLAPIIHLHFGVYPPVNTHYSSLLPTLEAYES